jgi:hypothetical protein
MIVTFIQVMAWAVVVGGIYMLFRNGFVFRYRNMIIEKDWDAYHRLPSYEDMLIRYWYVWPMRKFGERPEAFR